jgi:hypothetical protein
MALQIYDQREFAIPNIGLIKLADAETGEEFWFDSSSRKNRNKFSQERIKRLQKVKEVFDKTGTDHQIIETGEDYIKPLLKLFKGR